MTDRYATTRNPEGQSQPGSNGKDHLNKLAISNPNEIEIYCNQAASFNIGAMKHQWNMKECILLLNSCIRTKGKFIV